MKRLVLTVTGTVAGLAALLSFKTNGQVADQSALPAATLPTSGAASTSAAAPSPASTSTTAPSSSTPSSVSKTYVGSAVTTRYGVVQVEVTVANHKITHVAFAQLTAFDPRSQQINSFAGPQLLQETLSTQSAQVDTISGASYTSDGYRQSLQSALDKAGS